MPEDIDHKIREFRREMKPLADLFTTERQEQRLARCGRGPDDRLYRAGPVKSPQRDCEDDQPLFAKVNFALATYGLILPVSNELAADEVANLFSYLAKWFAKKQIITENALLKAKLELLAASNILTTDNPVSKIKTILNKSLDPAVAANAVHPDQPERL